MLQFLEALFELMLYAPFNNFSVMMFPVLNIVCLGQEHKCLYDEIYYCISKSNTHLSQASKESCVQ